MMQHVHVHGFLLLGLIVMAVVWLPVLLKRFPLSLPMLAVACGYAFFLAVPSKELFSQYRDAVQTLLEFVLVIAVMGAGLKIDRPFSLGAWSSTWRLLLFGMPLSVAAIAALATWMLDLPLALGILLGGILAPTDPVLASNVQVGPPGVGEEGEVRFALTSEAGLNDGLAYPFVTLGLLMLSQGAEPSGWLERWLLVDVFWKIAAATILGFAVGRGLTALNQNIPEQFRISRSDNGFAAVGTGLLVYGLAELIACYGFVAVFIAAVTIRNTTQNLRYTRDVHSSASQIEQLVTFLVLLLFGGALAEGLIASLSVQEIAFALVALLVIRPVVMLLSFIGSKQPMAVRLATGFFGIRGLGSLYYTTYVLDQTHLGSAGLLWRLTGFIVLLSVFIYGLSANPIMDRLDRIRERRTAQPSPGEAGKLMASAGSRDRDGTG